MEKAIEALRYTMQTLAEQYGFLDPRVIEKSQMLDKLIVQYMTHSSLPEADPPLKDLSIRETCGQLCQLESIVSLHEEIKDLEQQKCSSDPLVWKKSRELDELLLAFIHR